MKSSHLLALLLPAACKAASAGSLPAALQDDPHGFDPALCAGGTVVDWFSQTVAGNAEGRRIVRLPDGDFVVAALTAPFGADASANGLWNIGLARYRLPCIDVAWPGAGTYGFWENRYVVYPNSNTPRYSEIRDLAVFGGQLYVLADRHSGPDASSQRDVYVLVFDLDGGFVGFYPALDSDLDERGAGFVFHQAPGIPPAPLPPAKLYVAATSYNVFPVIGPTPSLARMSRAGNGSLTRDADLGAGGNQATVHYGQPDGYCAAGANPCQAVANGIALSEGLGGTIQRIYLAGAARRTTAGDWDFLVIGVNASGVRDTSFGSVWLPGGRAGFAMAQFNAGGNLRDVGNAIAVQRGIGNDRIHVTGEVAQQPAAGGNGGNRGIGILRLLHNGDPDPAFGTGAGPGRMVLGGCPAAPCIDAFGRGDAEEFPRAIAFDQDRLVVVGREGRRGICPGAVGSQPCGGVLAPHYYQTSLAIVGLDGAVREHAALGVSLGDAILHGAVVSPDRRINAVGWVQDDARRRLLLARYRSDRLFGNGFQ